MHRALCTRHGYSVRSTRPKKPYDPPAYAPEPLAAATLEFEKAEDRERIAGGKETMRVKVYAPGFCSFKHIDEDGYMTLPDDARLHDVYKRLRVPRLFRKFLLSAVNSRQSKPDAKLKDGDVVSFLSPISGG